MSTQYSDTINLMREALKEAIDNPNISTAQYHRLLDTYTGLLQSEMSLELKRLNDRKKIHAYWSAPYGQKISEID